MDDHIKRLTTIIEGTRGDNGLQGRVTRIERDLYANPDTKEPGLVADVRRLQDSMDRFETTLRNLDWLVKIVGASGVAAALRVMFFT
jgi:hypothetical protein